MIFDGTSASARSLREFLSHQLFDDVLPFWARHAMEAGGGINTCIRDDGTIISRDKWLWSQWRAVWVYAYLYNTVQHRPEWLKLATDICTFVSRNGWDDSADGVGGWRLLLDGDGNVLRGAESIYVDGFAIYGLTQLARATGDDEILRLARHTADSVLSRLARPHDQLPHWPYEVPPGARVHGMPMLFSLVLWELGQLLNEDKYRDVASEMSGEIFAKFHRQDRNVVVERINVNGSEYSAPLGTAVVPGHVIEDMWFQIHIARDRGDRATIDSAVQLIRRHLELGWDDRFGGLLLAIDVDGREDIGWKFPDTKLWWPQVEAMYACLLAYEWSRESWCLEWYDRMHQYSFAHFPVPTHGEWTQRLKRDGTPMDEVIALPVKDPFHLPRALMLMIETLDRLSF
jgi:N-acylglucosamine 2-epimerase